LTYLPPQKSRYLTKKAISRAAFPADGLGAFSGWPSSGAGYDDHNNKNAYGNSDRVGGIRINRPVSNAVEHR
jgi:hypothetical protein